MSNVSKFNNNTVLYSFQTKPAINNIALKARICYLDKVNGKTARKKIQFKSIPSLYLRKHSLNCI